MNQELNNNFLQILIFHFDDKTCCGVKAFGNIRKIENADLIDGLGETAIMTGWFNRGAEFLSVIGVPTHYEQSGDCGIAFGEEAREAIMEIYKEMEMNNKP